MRVESKCDFCSEIGPAWWYPAKNFIAFDIGSLVSTSEGSWAACMTCHGLIEAGDRKGLADRSAALFVVGNPESADVIGSLRGELKRIHDLFFENRIGPAQPIAAEVHQ